MFTDMSAPPEMPIVIDHVALKDILGPPLFEMEVSHWAGMEHGDLGPFAPQEGLSPNLV